MWAATCPDAHAMMLKWPAREKIMFRAPQISPFREKRRFGRLRNRERCIKAEHPPKQIYRMMPVLPEVPSDLKRFFPFFLAGPVDESSESYSSAEEELSSDELEQMRNPDSSLRGKISVDELIHAGEVNPTHSSSKIMSRRKSNFSRRIRRAVLLLKCNRPLVPGSRTSISMLIKASRLISRKVYSLAEF